MNTTWTEMPHALLEAGTLVCRGSPGWGPGALAPDAGRGKRWKQKKMRLHACFMKLSGRFRAQCATLIYCRCVLSISSVLNLMGEDPAWCRCALEEYSICVAGHVCTVLR